MFKPHCVMRLLNNHFFHVNVYYGNVACKHDVYNINITSNVNASKFLKTISNRSISFFTSSKKMPGDDYNLDRAFVSAWDDDDEGIEPERNPDDKLEKKVLLAAEHGKLERLKELLEENPNLVNVTDKEGYTPLHRACYGNHVDVVKYLLQKGANIAAKTEMQWQPLHSCVHWDHIECAQVLIAEGADVNALSEGGQTPLHIAASHGACYDMVQLLLIHPYINPNLKNNSNETAFDIARRSSKYRNVFDMVDPLLDYQNIESV